MANKNRETETSNPETALQKMNEPEENMQLMSFADPAELLQQGFETEVFHKLQEGDSIFGLFLGRGPDIELRDPDPRTGEVISIPSWKIRGLDKSGREVGITLQVPGKYELNRFFRAHTPGNTLVGIRYRGRVQVGTRQVTKFDTMYKLDPNRQATDISEVEREKRLKAEAEAKANAEMKTQRPAPSAA